MKLLLHPKTDVTIKHFVNSPSHALLLDAPDGAGKQALALYITEQLLAALSMSQRNAQTQLIEPTESGSTPIEAIRSVRSSLRLSTTGKGDIRRVIIVTKAHTLTIEAQNAFLKLLEEPPADTVFMLLTSQIDALLPTIRSRVQRMKLVKPAKVQLTAFFASQGLKPNLIERAYQLSEGLPGLMNSLLSSSDEHELAKAIQTLKQIISSSPYERLIKINELSKTMELGLILNATEKIAHAALTQAVGQHKTSLVHRWTRLISKLEQVQSSLGANPSSKLVLTDLFLNI